MTTSRRVFVLVGDKQTPLSPSDVADAVISAGFPATAKRFGYSVSTLQRFLVENEVRLRRRVSYEPVTELEELALGG